MKKTYTFSKSVTVVVLLVSTFVLSAAKIYKYTDADGNIHYTDQKPDNDAQEADLQKITIVKSSSSTPKSTWEPIPKETTKPFAINDFVISSPKNEESIWGTGGNVSVSVQTDSKIPNSYRVKFYIDNIPHGRVKSNTQLIADVERGEHTLYAKLIDSRSRKVIKTTPTIKFHLKQRSKK